MKALLVVMLLAGTASADSWKAEIKPASLAWKVTKPVDVVLVVTNTSTAKQALRVMSCSIQDHWSSNDVDLGPAPWGCEKNALTTIEVAPGKSHQWTLAMIAGAKAKLGKHTLSMTFTPQGGTPVKSNAVTVLVTR